MAGQHWFIIVGVRVSEREAHFWRAICCNRRMKNCTPALRNKVLLLLLLLLLWMRTQGWVGGGRISRSETSWMPNAASSLRTCQRRHMFPPTCESICKNAANRPTDYPATIYTHALSLSPICELWTPTKLRRRFCACQCYTLLKLLSYFQRKRKKMHWSSCYLSRTPWQSFL